MNKIIATRGFPASGKTTWAEKYAADTGAINVNRDDIRSMLDIGQIGDNVGESQVTNVATTMINSAIRMGKDVVVSDTNLRAAIIKNIAKIAVDKGYSFEIVDFKVELDELIKRDSNRSDSVGEDVIRDMWAKFPYKNWKNAEDIVTEVKNKAINDKFAPFNNDSSLSDAVLVDVDGTVAHHNDARSPFDWSQVSKDTVDEPVAGIVRELYNNGTKVVIMSGRDAVCKDDTVAWLHDNKIPFHEIHMRPEGDMRKDYVVKDDLVRNNIEGRFHVRFALDDRQQVVDHYRSIGIKVFQVQPGDF